MCYSTHAQRHAKRGQCLQLCAIALVHYALILAYTVDDYYARQPTEPMLPCDCDSPQRDRVSCWRSLAHLLTHKQWTMVKSQQLVLYLGTASYRMRRHFTLDSHFDTRNSCSQGGQSAPFSKPRIDNPSIYRHQRGAKKRWQGEQQLCLNFT